MDQTKYVSSTPFMLARLVGEDSPVPCIKKAEWRVNALMEELMDGYPVVLEFNAFIPEKNAWLYTLDMETEDVGESFDDRLQELLNAMMYEGLVLSPAEVMIRSDEMNDERDSLFYIGPSDVSIDHFKQEMAIQKIAELLGARTDDPAMAPIALRLHRKSRQAFAGLLAEESSLNDVPESDRDALHAARLAAIQTAMNDSGWMLDPELGPMEVPHVPTAVLEVNSGEISLLGTNMAMKVIFKDGDSPDRPEGVYSVHESKGPASITDHAVAYAAFVTDSSKAGDQSQAQSTSTSSDRPRGG